MSQVLALILFMILGASMSLSGAQIKIPATVFDKLVQSSALDGKAAPRFFYAPLSIKLQMVESGDTDIVIPLPEGGGDIDLPTYIPQKKEAYFFKVKFDFLIQDKDQKTMRAFFINQTAPETVAGIRFGADCGVVLDLSSAFRPSGSLTSQGIEVTQNQKRYMQTLGGDFFFAWESDGETYVTRVRFYDSTKEKRTCP